MSSCFIFKASLSQVFLKMKNVLEDNFPKSCQMARKMSVSNTIFYKVAGLYSTFQIYLGPKATSILILEVVPESLVYLTIRLYATIFSNAVTCI